MIGLEPTFDEHLENLVAVFREVRRVLRDDGTLWLNYGDAYFGGKGASNNTIQQLAGRNTPTLNAGQHYVNEHGGTRPLDRPQAGMKPKDLMMMPARVAMALQADGWWIRSEIIYHKKNPMPESVTDRPTCAHEKLFLLSKSARYFYDAEAVRYPSRHPTEATTKCREHQSYAPESKKAAAREFSNGGMANLRNVWTIPTHSYSEAHFATFPPKLVDPCIKAGTSEKGVCGECGAPWVRQVSKEFVPQPDVSRARGVKGASGQKSMGPDSGWDGVARGSNHVTTTGWTPSCTCDAEVIPATVLDPFAGAGTVGLVAERMGRDSILIEINKNYATMARDRIYNDAPLLTDVQTEEL